MSRQIRALGLAAICWYGAGAAAAAQKAVECPAIANATVETVTNGSIKNVIVQRADPPLCDIEFNSGMPSDLHVSYAAQGGAERLASMREGNENARKLGIPVATAPAGVPKIGKDQAFAFSATPWVGLVATKGDAYVWVEMVLDDSASPSAWKILPEIARRVLASH